MKRFEQVFVALLLGFANCANATTYYADASRLDDSGNGLTWGNAKRTIQGAINVSISNDTIVVTNGVYAPISTANKKITIRSVSGASVTIIDGGGTNRCATLGSVSTHTNTVLTGLALQNGNADDVNVLVRYYGGGSFGGTLNNCTLISNVANNYGGGACYGTLNNCLLSNNISNVYGGGSYNGILNSCMVLGNTANFYGGGSSDSILNNCTLSGNTSGQGGGSFGGTLNNCVLSANLARFGGGGSYGGTLNYSTLTDNVVDRDGGGGSCDGTLNNCTLSGNTAKNYGGGSCGGTLNNCTLSGNTAKNYGGGSCYGTLNNCTLIDNMAGQYGGGSYRGTLNNSIVWNNVDFFGIQMNYYESTFTYSCITPIPPGSYNGGGNIVSAPLFVDAENENLRLRSGSPCINAGTNSLVVGTVDIAGSPRIQGGRVDIGAYEGGVSGYVISGRIEGMGVLSNMTSIVSSGGDLSFIAIETSRPFNCFKTNGVFASNNPVFTWKDVRGDGIITAVFQATLYVSATQPNDNGDGLTWGSAKCTIQAAIDASAVNDTIVVTNGIYAPISALNNKICVRSVNGARVTIIDAGGTNRCATLGGDRSYIDTVLTGFTLQNGKATQGGASYWGMLVNCNITCNTADEGGGSYEGILNSCTLTGNLASRGGGAYGGVLSNCTLIGNKASWLQPGAGVCESTLSNCIVWDNFMEDGGIDNYDTSSSFAYSCAWPLPEGEGNIDANPQLRMPEFGDFRLLAGSPCVDTGSDVLAVGTVDLNQNPRIQGNAVDMGAYEGGVSLLSDDTYRVLTLTASTNQVQGIALQWQAPAGAVLYRVCRMNTSTGQWEPLTEWIAELTFTDTRVLAGLDYSYAILAAFDTDADVISRVGNVATGMKVFQPHWYVDASRPNDNGDGASWLTAKRTIQAAVNGSQAYDAILVADGVYPPIVTDNKLLVIRSVNGASVTVVDGNATNRCATLGRRAGETATVMDGFTLRNGYANDDGLYSGNGGGAYGGTLDNCLLTENWADESGGASSYSTLNNCTLLENWSDDQGGGAYYGVLNNCLLTRNVSHYNGGGAQDCTLNNCTVVENVLQDMGDDGGGGVGSCILNNCILWGNLYTGGSPSNFDENSEISYSCAWPLPAVGVGNIMLDPKFRNAAAGDYRLLSSSPCVNAGTNGVAVGAVDLDGNPRIMNGRVDMGAYELMIPSVADALEGTTLAWTSGGTAEWFAQNEVVKEGEWALQSGPIGDNKKSWIETALTGPGRFSFWWRVSSEGAYDWLSYSVDGEEQGAISGTKDVLWLEETLYLDDAAHVLRWTYTKDESQREGTDAGWLDGVRWSPRVTVLFDGQGGTVLTNTQTYYAGDGYTNLPIPSLAGALFGGWWTTPSGGGVEVYNGNSVPSTNHTLYARWLSVSEVLNSPTNLVWSLGGDAFWFAQTNIVKQGAAALQSGSIGHNQQTWIETTVQGGCNMSFWWRVSSEGNYDFLSYTVNGVMKKRISGAKNIVWTQEVLTFTNAGTYTIRWTYSKDGSGVAGQDSAWLDGVEVTPLLRQTQTPVPVPFTWLDFYYPGLSEASAYEAAALGTGANNHPVWESYVAGLNPTNPLSQFTANISVSNDLRFITWTPDLRPDRVYTVLGKTNLTDTAWGPTNSASQFFRVNVEMP